MSTLTVTSGTGSEVGRDAESRLARLLGKFERMHEPDDSGVLTVRGQIGDAAVIVYASDASRMGGAIGADGCQHVVAAIGTAVRERIPVIGVWHSGGARLPEGVAALDGVGSVFAAMVQASGQVPQISVVLGPCAGGAAYGPALTDIVIMSSAARIFVTGPDVVRSVTGEDVTAEDLGGPDTHTRRSGVVHVTAPNDGAALDTARRVTLLLGQPGSIAVPPAAGPDLSQLLPERPARAYDVKPLVAALLDEPGLELQPEWGPNIKTTLGRLGGRSVGVLANNPLRLGGCLDSVSAEKASRFVRMCDSFGLPLVVLVDVPGYLPGARQEWEGVVRRGAKLLHAFAEAAVPRVTLVTRKAYGGAYIAMNSRSLGATAVFAWPQAEVAVMGAAAAVNVLHRKQLAAAPPDKRDDLRTRLAEEHAREAGGVGRALEIGAVDALIQPTETRHRIALALATAPSARGRHRNIPL